MNFRVIRVASIMKITLNRPVCIGCGSCVAVCPLFFEIIGDGKAHIKNSQKDEQEIESIEVVEAGCAKEAADICPVQAIVVQE